MGDARLPGMGDDGRVVTDEDMIRYARAVPLAAITAYGLGPLEFQSKSSGARERLRAIRGSETGLLAARDSAGTLGRQILALVAMVGGRLSPDRLAIEAAGADPTELTPALARLCDAGLISRVGPDDAIVANPQLERWSERPDVRSLYDKSTITSEALTRIVRTLKLQPANRKQEKLDQIAELFATPDQIAAVLDGLSVDARRLLFRIADKGGVTPVEAGDVGLDRHELSLAEVRSNSYGRQAHEPRSSLWQLTHHGLVGVEPWSAELWIWIEAWPLLERPFFPVWASHPAPATVTVTGQEPRLPAIVPLMASGLTRWELTPPKVLKNGEHRLAKTEIRAAAKALGTDEAVIEVISRLLLDTGLLLANTVSTSGRGRNRTVDQVWMVDPDAIEAWNALSAAEQWLVLVRSWTNPPDNAGDGLLMANRHLLLWELLELPLDRAWVEADEVGHWMHTRYDPVGHAGAIHQSINDLRVLGLVPSDGPVRLTALARLTLSDPGEAADALSGGASAAIIQADLTVVAPPDLDPTMAQRLSQFAVLESDTGALTYRLDEALITRSIQAGTEPDEIESFLDELSSVPIPQTVGQLIRDSAQRVGRVKVHPATTVVVTADPIDMATAMSIKSAKLHQVAPTVAISTLTPAKVRTALDRRGLHPELVGEGGSGPSRRRSSEDAEAIEQRAEMTRKLAARTNNAYYHDQAQRLESQAEGLRDPAGRLRVTEPLALDPRRLGELGSDVSAD